MSVIALILKLLLLPFEILKIAFLAAIFALVFISIHGAPWPLA